MKLMILTKTDGDFPLNSYMLSRDDGGVHIIIPKDCDQYEPDDSDIMLGGVYHSPLGGSGYDAYPVEFKDVTVLGVSFGWVFLTESYDYEAREATAEELETFLSLEEYHE